MWGREKILKPGTPGSSRGAMALRMSRWLANIMRSHTRDISLLLPGRVRSFQECVLNPTVLDGLGLMSAAAGGAGLPGAAAGACAGMQVVDVAPLRRPAVRMVEPAINPRIMVMDHKPIAAPGTRSLAPPRPGENMLCRSLSPMTDVAPVRSCEKAFLASGTAVRNATSRMQRMPQMRHSEDTRDPGRHDFDAFIREAQAARGIAEDQAELVAVFRRVPIESVSKIRFVDSSRMLFFTLSADATRRQARVHDIAAVLDRSSGKTWLVPHRTRFQTALLR